MEGLGNEQIWSIWCKTPKNQYRNYVKKQATKRKQTIKSPLFLECGSYQEKRLQRMPVTMLKIINNKIITK